MSETAWAYLPNARHIDAILAHLETHPHRWNAARDAARDAAWGAARGAARDAARDAAWGAAWGAIASLAAWDDADTVFAMPPDAVKLLKECGNHQAILLYPAVLAMQGEPE